MRQLAADSNLPKPVIAFHWTYLTYEGLLQILVVGQGGLRLYRPQFVVC